MLVAAAEVLDARVVSLVLAQNVLLEVQAYPLADQNEVVTFLAYLDCHLVIALCHAVSVSVYRFLSTLYVGYQQLVMMVSLGLWVALMVEAFGVVHRVEIQ